MFSMSVEHKPLHSHAGGDLPGEATEARQAVEARYAYLLAKHEPVHTIAIMLDGQVFDVFDGFGWASEMRWPEWETDETSELPQGENDK